MNKMNKYYVTVCIVFLLMVPWFMGAPFEWMVWVPVVFLGLIYIPASYEAAIDRESVSKGILSFFRGIFSALFLFFLLTLVIGMVGSFLTLLLTFNQEGPVVVTFLHFFSAFEQNPLTFLMWNFASFSAVVYLGLEIEELCIKKEVEKKEDSKPDVEE